MVCEFQVSFALCQRILLTIFASVIEFGRLTRSHLPRCLGYVDQPKTFGSNLEEHAKKLLLIVWSVRTVQLFNMKPIKMASDLNLLSTAGALAKKSRDPYISTVAAFVQYRQLDSKEESERLCDEYLKEHGLENGRNPNNPGHGGRFNAALGDLVVFRGCLRRDLRRGDDPSVLLHAWDPINPESPSILERNVKWWRDRTVGSHYTAIGRYEEAEKILVSHVAEFPKIDFTGTDEHLAGCDHLASLYYVQKDWEKAEKALRGPVQRAYELDRDRMAWHVLYAEIRLQEILVCGGKFKEAKTRVLRSNRQLLEMALPDFTIGPMFATWCLVARIAHEQEQWKEAEENWTKALNLGKSMDWPTGPDMNLAQCSLEALRYESENKPCDEKTFKAWRDAIYVSRDGAEGGQGNNFLDGFGDDWRNKLEARLEKHITIPAVPAAKVATADMPPADIAKASVAKADA